MNEEKNNQVELNDQEMENAAGGCVIRTPRKKTIFCFHCGARFKVSEGEKGFVQCPNCGKTVDSCRTYR